MKIIKKLSIVALSGMFALAGTSAFAQDNPGTTQESTAPQQSPGAAQQPAPQQSALQVKEDFSDESLRKFVEINKKLEPHQRDAENQMVQAIEEQGMKADRFNEILTARQQGDTNNAGATTEELGKFDSAAQKIMGIQNTIIPKMEEVISAEGMKPEEFQQIVLAYNHSPVVQQKIRALMQPPAQK